MLNLILAKAWQVMQKVSLALCKNNKEVSIES